MVDNTFIVKGGRSSSGGRKEKEEEGPDVPMLFEHAFAYIYIYIHICCLGFLDHQQYQVYKSLTYRDTIL